jgi:hypothetical protein
MSYIQCCLEYRKKRFSLTSSPFDFIYFPAEYFFFFLTFSTFAFIYIISFPIPSLLGSPSIMFYFSSPLLCLFVLTQRMFRGLCSIFKYSLFFAPLSYLFSFLQIKFPLLLHFHLYLFSFKDVLFFHVTLQVSALLCVTT